MTAFFCLLLGIALGAGGVVLWAKNHDNDPEAADGWWTVVGVWTLSKERWSLHVQAADARQAEDLAQHEAKFDVGKELWITAVFPGKLENADKYATFVDPEVKPTDWLNHGSENPL